MLRCRSGYKSSWESGFTRLNEATFRGNHNDHQRWPLAKQDLTSIMYNTFACICADFVSWLKVTSHVLKSSYTWADSLQGHSKVAFNSWNSLWTWIPGCIGSTTPKTNFQDWVLRISGELQPAKPHFMDVLHVCFIFKLTWSFLLWERLGRILGYSQNSLLIFGSWIVPRIYRLYESAEVWDGVKSFICLQLNQLRVCLAKGRTIRGFRWFSMSTYLFIFSSWTCFLL
jgi:hypothetical protein